MLDLEPIKKKIAEWADDGGHRTIEARKMLIALVAEVEQDRERLMQLVDTEPMG